MEFLVIPERIQLERFMPVKCFRKIRNTSRVISFLSLLLEFPEISVAIAIFTVNPAHLHYNELHRGITLWMLIASFTEEMWILPRPKR